jgi:hypothetical protein
MLRYFVLMAASALLSLGLVWGWAATMPMAFMEAEYPSWQAKRLMLDRCDLGDTIILGDSRAAADILPTRLGFAATNLAIGGGEPIEALALLTRAMACPSPPRRVILSFDAGHFVRPDLFWERSVRFGFLASDDIAALRAISAATGDQSVYEEHHADGLPSRLRDWLAVRRFPYYDFASLTQGGGFLRINRNLRLLRETLAARGHYSFGINEGSDLVAVEGHLDDFRPLPVLDHYFDALLTQLDRHGIETLFLPMPINDATWRAVNPALRDEFAGYLAGYATRYRRFHIAGEVMPHWPNQFFGDGFCHLNPDGARRFSDELAQRLQAAPPSTQKDAQNGWFNATGRNASASVVPISKRGS